MVDAPFNRVSLKQRVLQAGAWRLAGFALNYTIRLGSSLVMTRLLVPEMFGVMTITMTVITGLALFLDTGVQPFIVQSRRGSDPAYLNTVWAIQIIRGLIISLLALCISLIVLAADHVGLMPKGSVYADPNLPYVIASVSIFGVIDGFQSTKLFEASRGLSLGRITQIRIAAQIIGLICMIGWALIDRSIWALVAGFICSTGATTLLSHIWLPGVANRWQWDRSAFHEIIHFGKWIFLSSTLGFFANNADRILLGGFVGSATLGIYGIASNVFGLIVQILNMIFMDLSFPALSEVARERSLELKRSLYGFHVVAAPFSYFCSGVLFVSGNTLIRFMYDPRYEQAGWMLEILVVALLAFPFNLSQWCLLARGLPKLFSGLLAIRVAAIMVLIPLGFHFFGLSGALWAIVISQFSSLPATIYYQLKYDLFDLSMEVMLLPALFVGMIVGKGFNLAVGY